MATTQRHWLDKATPKYWQPRGLWRVRLMRDGKQYQWLLKGGKADPSSSGRVKAEIEWAAVKASILKGEQQDEQDGGMFIRFETDEQERQHFLRTQQHYEYQNSPYAASISFDEWQAFKEWQRFRELTAKPQTLPQLATEQPQASQPFSILLDAFQNNLTQRFEKTDPTRQTKKPTDIGRDRYDQYKRCVKHIKGIIGNEAIKPIGEFLISELQLSKLLKIYREKTEQQAAKDGLSGYWFNEQMKTVRLFVSFLQSERLVSAVCPNIEALTARYEVDSKSKPMPVEVIKAFWQAADPIFRCYMLAALNLGWRQAELAVAEVGDLKQINGRLCVERARGKTGVEYLIPLWEETAAAFKQYGQKEGRLLFVNRKGKPLVNPKTGSDCVYGMLQTVRNKAALIDPRAANYSFENFRDTGATFIDGKNKTLTPFYLAQADGRQAAAYVGNVDGETPMTLDAVLEMFRQHLGLFKLP